jgi:hypothetical protein
MTNTRSAALAAAVVVTALTLPTMAVADPSTEYKIVVGAINDPANTEYAQDASDDAIPQLPVVYDDGGTISETGAGGAHQ